MKKAAEWLSTVIFALIFVCSSGAFSKAAAMQGTNSSEAAEARGVQTEAIQFSCLVGFMTQYIDVLYGCKDESDNIAVYDLCVITKIASLVSCTIKCLRGSSNCDGTNPTPGSSLLSGVYERSDTGDCRIEFVPTSSTGGRYKLCDWSKDAGYYEGTYNASSMIVTQNGVDWVYDIIKTGSNTFTLEVQGIGAGAYKKVSKAFNCAELGR